MSFDFRREPKIVEVDPNEAMEDMSDTAYSQGQQQGQQHGSEQGKSQGQQQSTEQNKQEQQNKQGKQQNTKDKKVNSNGIKLGLPPFVKFALIALTVIIIVTIFAMVVVKREQYKVMLVKGDLKKVTEERDDYKVKFDESQQLVNSLNNRLQLSQHQLSQAMAHIESENNEDNDGNDSNGPKIVEESFAIPVPEVNVGEGVGLADGSEEKREKPLSRKEEIRRMVNARRPQNSDFMNAEQQEMERRKLDEDAENQIQNLINKDPFRTPQNIKDPKVKEPKVVEVSSRNMKDEVIGNNLGSINNNDSDDDDGNEYEEDDDDNNAVGNNDDNIIDTENDELPIVLGSGRDDVI